MNDSISLETAKAIIGGGYPLRRDGDIVGTIGVSGGAVEQDMDVARTGVDEFDELPSSLATPVSTRVDRAPIG